MKPRIAVTPIVTQPGAPLPLWIEATDLTDTPDSRPLWRRRTGLPSTCDRPGRPSPMGFWLTEHRDSNEPITEGSLRIELIGSADDAPEPPAPSAVPLYRRPTQVIRVKAANAADGDLVLSIGPEHARVIASPASWEAFAEPVLLAACQYWRFARLDDQLDRLTAQAEGDIGHAAMSVPATLWKRGRLLATARAVRALLLDLPHFTEPLTDPFPFCSSERSVQTYRSLAEKLHLEAWCEAIDDRAEMVEDTYAGVTEKLFEYRNFAWGSVLEITIIVILLADLILQVWARVGGE